MQFVTVNMTFQMPMRKDERDAVRSTRMEIAKIFQAIVDMKAHSDIISPIA